MRAFALTLFAAALFLAGPAVAQDAGFIHEAKVGVLHHDTPNLWSSFNRESGVDLNAEVIFSPSVDFLTGTVRPALGGSLNSVGDTSKAYLTSRWEKDLGADFSLALGVGLAVHDGNKKLTRTDRKALGSSVLFYFPIELGYGIDDKRTVSLFFDHVSNAWLADPNEDMDTLGLRFGYKF